MSDKALISKAIIDEKITPMTMNCLKITAGLFNKITITRRKMVLQNMSNPKGAKDWIKECPSREYLFASQLKELAKALKDEAQVD